MLDLFTARYPYTDFHELNLDWLISKVMAMNVKLDNFVSLNTIKYADPIGWDITSQYEANTVVLDQNTGIAYISSQPVPSGVSLSNPDYWSVIFDLQQIIGSINENITYHNDGTSPTSTFTLSVGDWVLWNSKLYKVIQAMSPGYAYIEGSNIEAHSVEELVKELITAIYVYIGELTDLTTSDKTSVVNAINSIVTALNTVISDMGDLSTLLTTDKSNLVNAINEVLNTLITTTGDLNNLTTTDKSNLVNAINEVLNTLITTIGDLNDLTTTDVSNIVNAINSEHSERVQSDSDIYQYFNNKIDNMSKYKDTYINVKTLGAIGDGTAHPLSEKFSTLVEAQLVYPFVTALTQSIDYATLQKAVNDYDGIYIPAGRYVLSDTIVIPQSVSKTIVGDDPRRTVLYATYDRQNIISFDRQPVAGYGSVLEITDVGFNGNDFQYVIGVWWHGVIVNSSRYEDNWLRITRCTFIKIFRGVDLYCCGSCYFDRLYAQNTSTIFFLGRAASFIHAINCLALICDYFMYAEDSQADGISNGIELINCEAIFPSNTAFRIYGWQGVYLIRCSADLGSVAGANLFIYMCQDVSITDCWVAGSHIMGSFGIRLWFCKDVSMKGCTVQNCTIGVRIDGTAGQSAGIVIDACVFEGHTHNDIMAIDVNSISIVNCTFFDVIALAGSNAPVYWQNVDDSVITLNRFRNASYGVTLGTNCIGASNLFSIKAP